MIALARPDDEYNEGHDTDYPTDPQTADEPISQSNPQKSADKPYWTKSRITAAIALIGGAAVGIAEAVRLLMQHKE